MSRAPLVEGEWLEEGLAIEVSSPCCGATFIVINTGMALTLEASVILACSACQRQYQASVRLIAMPRTTEAARVAEWRRKKRAAV